MMKLILLLAALPIIVFMILTGNIVPFVVLAAVAAWISLKEIGLIGRRPVAAHSPVKKSNPNVVEIAKLRSERAESESDYHYFLSISAFHAADVAQREATRLDEQIARLEMMK